MGSKDSCEVKVTNKNPMDPQGSITIVIPNEVGRDADFTHAYLNFAS